ncbi:MAG: nucleotide-binding protein [Candidatus Bathyarchaeota archaeon]|nr:nucleotide-binding protein [Candidatus Bathyarchaeum sp.]
MAIDFGSLIIELETLAYSSKEDFSEKFWSSYENYVNTYNKILNDIQALGFYKELKPIEPVPFSEQTFDSGFTKQEQAKLREVANASNILLQKVKLLLAPPTGNKKINNQVRSNKIFLVHGNDPTMKTDVTQTLQKLDLDPIIVHEQQTITKTINENPHVSFAVVLLSPDNRVYPKEKTPQEAKTQANQNSIFELGYFLGHLGPQNVAAIYQKTKDFKIPNQDNQILWIEYKTGWYLKLIKELKAANFDVDANKLGWL